jgi:hypothetical protein
LSVRVQPGSFDPGELGIDENEFGADRLQNSRVLGRRPVFLRAADAGGELTCAAWPTKLESFTYRKEHPMEHDEKKKDEKQQNEERDEMEDLDVSQQKAEDVKGGARARRPQDP